MTTITTAKQFKGLIGYLVSALERYLDELGHGMCVQGLYARELSKSETDSNGKSNTNMEGDSVRDKELFWYGGGCCCC